MPGNQHLSKASPKENRQYEHIKESELAAGKAVEDAKRIAAATVRKGQVLGHEEYERQIKEKKHE